MMDRIAELEGQLATPEPTPMPEPEPYVPGGPFPGIPDFIRDLDFRDLPDFSNFDYDDIMRQYNDRMEMGEPEPIESFLPDISDLPPMGLNPPPGGFDGKEPRFTTMPVPDGPRGPGMNIGDMLEGRVTRMPVGDPKPIYTPPPMVPNTPKIPTIPNIDFSNLPKFDLPTTGGRPMIPDFGNINLR
tara:strand:- start:56 stop:613 length:558 start_codon:yes stop_codon:yes gene_type:complete